MLFLPFEIEPPALISANYTIYTINFVKKTFKILSTLMQVKLPLRLKGVVRGNDKQAGPY